jgi:hypothetical protein
MLGEQLEIAVDLEGISTLLAEVSRNMAAHCGTDEKNEKFKEL